MVYCYVKVAAFATNLLSTIVNLTMSIDVYILCLANNAEFRYIPLTHSTRSFGRGQSFRGVFSNRDGYFVNIIAALAVLEIGDFLQTVRLSLEAALQASKYRYILPGLNTQTNVFIAAVLPRRTAVPFLCLDREARAATQVANSTVQLGGASSSTSSSSKCC